jgi:hypothetical protein
VSSRSELHLDFRSGFFQSVNGGVKEIVHLPYRYAEHRFGHYNFVE